MLYQKMSWIIQLVLETDTERYIEKYAEEDPSKGL